MEKLRFVWRLGAISALMAGVAACGPDEQERPSVDLPEGPVEEADKQPVELASVSGCAIDSDCEAGRFCFQGTCAFECEGDDDCGGSLSCSERGQCVGGGATVDESAQTLVTEFYDDVRVVNAPKIKFEPTTPDDQVALELEFDQTLPDDGMAYRMSRSDGVGEPGRVRHTEGGVDSVSIPIALGKADPTLSDSTTVQVEVSTPVGSYQVTLQPSFPASGQYSGTALVDTFGRVGLPIDFELVTDPAGAPLDEAQTAWLVLPVSSDRLFSPVYPDGTIDHLAAELTHDDFVDKWVATFDYAFDLNDAQIWEVPESDQVERSLRFEIAMEGKHRVEGSFTDRWSGLYEVDSAQGVTTIETVVTTGELRLQRVANARSAGELNDATPAQADPQLLAAPGIDACQGLTIFELSSRDIDGESYGCDAIASAEDFEAATPEEMASCAIAAGDETLSAETTSGQIRAFLDDEVDNPGGQSFEEFLEDCAAGTDGTCRPTPEVTCSRQLLARAYHDQPEGSTQMDALVEGYLDVARESYLGQQLGAFATDFNLRMDWLETTDYPAVVTSAVQDLNEQLLDEWKEKVLDVHVGVLTGQFDPSGLAVMARETNSTEAGDARQRLLMEMTQSWRGAMDSLTLATARWNTLLQAQTDRDEKVGYVTQQMFRLYVTASALRKLARSADAG